jgi:hypothetical protein
LKRLAPVLVVLIGFSFAIPTTAQAIPVVGVFSGYIDEIGAPQYVLDEIGIGTKFEGYFSYDSDSPVFGDLSTDPNTTAYRDPSFAINLVFFGKSNDYHFATSMNPMAACYIWVSNNSEGQDTIQFWRNAPFTEFIAGIIPNEVALNLWDSSGTAFDDTSLPTKFNFEDFDSSGFWVEATDDPQNALRIFGHFESLEVQPVPEPSTMLLLASGLVGLAGFRKKLLRR